MDDQFKEALETLEKILRERQQRVTDKLKDGIPEGYAIRYNLLKIVPNDQIFVLGGRPKYMKDALSAHAFMHCGLLPNDHRKATCIIRGKEWEMEVEDWLAEQSRSEILSFWLYGEKSLQLLIDVLKWHGYDTTRLES